MPKVRTAKLTFQKRLSTGSSSKSDYDVKPWQPNVCVPGKSGTSAAISEVRSNWGIQIQNGASKLEEQQRGTNCRNKLKGKFEAKGTNWEWREQTEGTNLTSEREQEKVPKSNPHNPPLIIAIIMIIIVIPIIVRSILIIIDHSDRAKNFPGFWLKLKLFDLPDLNKCASEVVVTNHWWATRKLSKEDACRWSSERNCEGSLKLSIERPEY